MCNKINHLSIVLTSKNFESILTILLILFDFYIIPKTKTELLKFRVKNDYFTYNFTNIQDIYLKFGQNQLFINSSNWFKFCVNSFNSFHFIHFPRILTVKYGNVTKKHLFTNNYAHI